MVSDQFSLSWSNFLSLFIVSCDSGLLNHFLVRSWSPFLVVYRFGGLSLATTPHPVPEPEVLPARVCDRFFVTDYADIAYVDREQW